MASRAQQSIHARSSAFTAIVNALLTLLSFTSTLHGISAAPPSTGNHYKEPQTWPSYSGWQAARASFYGQDGGATIHQGSCMFGYIDPNRGTGWDIAAMTDADPDYYGSCGRCYEVACVPSTFKDSYGQVLNRDTACYDPSRTVVVRITDTCPCHYPDNSYSNRRWCCGDMRHFDLSQQAFQKLADTKLGVVGIRFRPVACPAM